MMKLESKTFTESQANTKVEVEAEAEAEKKHKKRKGGPKAASLADISVKLETLQSIPMEDVFRIAQEATEKAELLAK